MENRNISFSKIWIIVKVEFQKWITNPKMVLLVVFLLFARTLIIVPLLDHATKYGEPINAFEPFIAMGNSGLLSMLIPMLYLVLLGDFPCVEANSLFYISRSGKRNWLIGQLIFMVCAIGTLIAIVLIVSMVMSHGKVNFEWSNVVTKYGTRFPNEKESFGCTILPSNLYNQLHLGETLVYTLLFQYLHLIVLSLILCTGKIYKGGMFGFISTIVIVCMGVITTSLKLKIMWVFPMAHTIVWLHYREIISNQIFPIRYSFLIYLFLIVILTMICFEGLDRMKFEVLNGD